MPDDHKKNSPKDSGKPQKGSDSSNNRLAAGSASVPTYELAPRKDNKPEKKK